MTALTADYWSRKSLTGYAPNWFSLCADEITRRVTGQTNVSLTSFLIQKHAPPNVGDLLEIGCLNGRKLSTMADRAKRLHGVDIADGAIEEGRRLYPNIDFAVQDLNAPRDVDQRFDVILSNGVLHHIENLEAAADWIAAHLSPSGVLIASEYVGPVRYRYSRAEVAAINGAIALLPAELQHTFHPDQLAGKLKADPSESIRSRDIVDTLRAAGLSVQVFPYGGNTAARALGHHFFKHFNPDNPEHRLGLERVIASDWAAMHRFPSHHTAIVAKRHIS